MTDPIETGWLIERPPDKHRHIWLRLTGLGYSWTNRADLALRFAREVDAAKAIHFLGVSDAKPSEHQWG